MPTFQIPSLSPDAAELPKRTLAYFRRRLRHELHELVLREFMRQVAESPGLTKKRWGKRIHKRPEQMTRLLGSPGNWTLNTLSDLLVGLGIDPRRAVKALNPQKAATIELKDAPPVAPAANLNDDTITFNARDVFEGVVLRMSDIPKPGVPWQRWPESQLGSETVFHGQATP